MKQRIGEIALLVRSYDEAIAYYTGVLGFRLLEDTAISPGKRWVRVAPPGDFTCALLLAQVRGEDQEKAIGRQAGGRVFLFLHTDDFWRDYEGFRARGVRFCESPREEAYGTVAVFEDLYGNRWDLLQLRNAIDGAPSEQRRAAPGEIAAAEASAAAVVQRQLDAYNARDLTALLAIYADDAEMFEFPATLLARGSDQLRERFAARFREPNLHAALRHRSVTRNTVIDEECVTRTFPEGPGEIELTMIYQVIGQRIAKAWSIVGEKRLHHR